MKSTRTCEYCKKTFQDIEGKVFANHVRWCPENKTNGDKGRIASGTSLKKFHISKIGELKQFDVTCQKCNKHFIVTDREKKFDPHKSRYCSRACANSRGPRNDTTKQKVKEKLTLPRVNVNCKICDKEFIVPAHRIKLFCSGSCANKNRYIHSMTPLKEYRSKCAFKFNLADFANEFDFSLVESYGWYKAKNHGNNLNGVSRDHMVSVMFGFTNNIDPNIISHPANCRLIRHNENVSKGSKCAITLEELMGRIEAWNLKYSK